MISWFKSTLSRRALFGGAAAAVASAKALAQAHHGAVMRTVGNVDNTRNGFDPHQMLQDWDTGVASKRADGRTVREFEISVIERDIEIAPGLMFPAWTYNGRVPGPSLRVTEGDIVRVHFTNSGTHKHNMHFHGIHSALMDGIPGIGDVAPGESFVYEFEALPFGCHLYHCHSLPLRRHVHKGLYGAFIIDPAPQRRDNSVEQSAARGRLLGSDEHAQWQEFMMIMNGFDVNFDDENEVYAVNTVAHAYAKRPIQINRARPVRVYLINITEFDPINSFHLHANFFNYYDHGTSLTPTSTTIDTVMQCQGQRGILEFSFKDHEPGNYMFHAHQAEFSEQGWTGFFEVS